MILMAKSNYEKSLYNQYEELVLQYEELKKLLKSSNQTIVSLNKTIEELKKVIENLEQQIAELKKDNLKLRADIDKDSSNSSKPSSTNGFKKVITNRREKSNKKQGGQKGHKPHSLKNKLDQFLKSGNVREEIIEVNKNKHNQNKRFIEKVVIDIEVIKVAKRYRYYPYPDGTYHIPTEHNQYVQYGNTLKSICIDLMSNLYNSTDGVVRFIDDITNGGITLSKGTLINWNNSIRVLLQSQLVKIEEQLLLSYYLNCDESQIKINGEAYNILCSCNNKYTRLWVHKHKLQEALDEIGFLPQFRGIIVKDGTDLYNKYGIIRAQCISHILRYLVDYYTKIKHNGAKKMSDFLSSTNTYINKLKDEGYTEVPDQKRTELIKEYESIAEEWGKEIKDDKDNYLRDEEYCLWRRMYYDNKKMDPNIRGDKEEILYFVEDLRIPSTNNPAEVSQRNAKIKQKIGKWRSTEGAEAYVEVRSCINTYKKNGINILGAITAAFNGNPIIV